jgi:CHAT domain-containing protein
MNEQRQQAYLNLIQVLLSSPDVKVEILAANQDLLDAGFLKAVRNLAEIFLQQGDENTANWLRNLENLVIEALNLNFKHPHTAQNSEIPEDIVNYYLDFILKVLELVADSKNNLELSYLFLEANIDKLNHVLTEVLWRWATVTLEKVENGTAQYLATVIGNFGNLISQFPLGDKADNIEIAITSYEIVLNTFTHKDFPIEWAKAQSNLGVLYANRIMGDKANNLEQSITVFQKALDVYTRKDFPYEWAVAKNNLGIAYRDRIIEAKASNTEQSITSLQSSLSIRTYDAFPYEWAMTQYNLGLAYIDRVDGDKADNIEKSIAAFQEALKVQSEHTFPTDWATTKNALGVAYEERILGDITNNLEESIACYQATLAIRTRDDFPYEWAQAQHNLGNAYYQRIKGDKNNNIEISITAYKAALKVRTREAFPYEWAQTQNNLGNVYRHKIQGNKLENIQLALTALKASVDGAEFLREQIISGYRTKQKLAEEWNQSYIGIVESFLEVENITEALEYAERSKTRNLVELILERDFKAIYPPDIIHKLEQLRDAIAVGQYQIQTSKIENHKKLAQHLQKLRQQRNDLQDTYLPVGYGFNFKQFQETLDERSIIIEWYITNASIETFIITHNSLRRASIVKISDNLSALIGWVNEYLEIYFENKTDWKDNLKSRLNRLAEILHLEEVIQLIPKFCSRLVLIPHRYLHIFPLHALPLSNDELLYEKFPDGVSYAPSLQILQQLQMRDRPDFQNLFAIQNPTGDLNYTDLEVQVIQSYFNNANILKKSAATLTEINDSDLNTYHCAHFSCHGYFNLTNPGKSALILANSPTTEIPTNPDSEHYLNLRDGQTHDLDKCLTLDKIFTLKLEKCRLVTLSACETAFIDFNNTSDEYIGLPSGFLLAGSQAVVSSLWTVDDLSTSFLMIKFYENLQTINNVSLALNQAQQWLRNLTTEEFEALLVKYQPQIEESFAQLPEEKRPVAKAILKRTCKRKPHPFAAPFYWAGFIATGI